MSNRVEQWFGAYQAIEIMEQGGTAIVYRGLQPSLGRTVAIKVLLDSRNPQFAARFRREARAVAQLEHHNILPVYDYGEQNGLLYVVTQYVEHNLTLQDILGDPMEPLAALRLISSVLEGLEYAHGQGVVHRNIKPTSILLPLPDWPVLGDFGIARFDEDDYTMTMPGISLESAQYMAPEFLEGQPTDTRTDLYSLGAVFYHMVVGRPPFVAATPLAMLQEHAATPLPDPRASTPALPGGLADLIVRALAKHPADRFPSAKAMLEATRQVAAQIELSSGDHRLHTMYQAGIHAFAEGDWNRALDQLRQVQELSPQHTSAAQLIAFAHEAQRRARQQAQTRLARLQKDRALTPMEQTAISMWSQPAPRTQLLPKPAVHPGEYADNQVPMLEQRAQPLRRVRLRPVYYVAAIIGVLVLIVLLLVMTRRGFAV